MISKHISVLTLCLGIIFFSCGKKEDNTQSQTQQNQTQNIQQEQTQPKLSDSSGINKTQQQDTDKRKEEEQKKAEEKKNQEQKKKEDLKIIDDGTKQESTGLEFLPIWKKKCIKCHGLYGTGKVEGVPDLTSPIIKKKSDQTLINSITNGIKGETEDDEDMPAWKGKLTEEEIKAAVKYVKGLSP